jgi:hypothetical protein
MSECYIDEEKFTQNTINTCDHTTLDLFSLKNCSIWFINIISKFNKCYERHIIYGKNENISSFSNLPTNLNIQNSLPIDFSLAQQFVYEKSLEKMKFSIKYDIEKTDCPIKALNKDYSNFIFE